MYVQDRAGRGPRALEQAVGGITGPANQTPGLVQVFTLFNTVDAANLRRHRPHQGRDAGRSDHALLRHAVDLYGLGLRQRLQHSRPHLSRLRAGGQSVPPLGARRREFAHALDHGRHGPARLGRDLPRHHRPLSRAALQPVPGRRGAGRDHAGLLHRTGDRRDGEDRGANLPSGFGFEWTEIALQEKVAGNTAAIAFALAVVFVFLLLAAQYESCSSRSP